MTRFAAVVVFDGMTATPRSLDFRKALIASISVLDAVAVPVVSLDPREAIGTLVLILDHIAVRGTRHGLSHPGGCYRTERHEEAISHYIVEVHRSPYSQTLWNMACSSPAVQIVEFCQRAIRPRCGSGRSFGDRFGEDRQLAGLLSLDGC